MSAPAREVVEAACHVLAGKDVALARGFAACGVPDWRARPATYETLARLVAYQQISTVAAASIWARVEAHLGEVTVDRLLAAPDEALQGCGLSRPKIAHMKSIAGAVQTGALDLAGLTHVPLEDARRSLLAVKGIGPWTAELVVLYALGQLDAFPPGDVGLMESYKQLARAEDRLSGAAFSQLVETWRPYRGVAAHLLWAWLNLQRANEKQARQTGKLS